MIVPPEKIYRLYKNKYKAIHIASIYARKLKEDQVNGLLEEQMNPVLETMRRLLTGKIKYSEE